MITKHPSTTAQAIAAFDWNTRFHGAARCGRRMQYHA
jgi:hypothetical protein